MSAHLVTLCVLILEELFCTFHVRDQDIDESAPDRANHRCGFFLSACNTDLVWDLLNILQTHGRHTVVEKVELICVSILIIELKADVSNCASVRQRPELPVGRIAGL